MKAVLKYLQYYFKSFTKERDMWVLKNGFFQFPYGYIFMRDLIWLRFDGHMWQEFAEIKRGASIELTIWNIFWSEE